MARRSLATRVLSLALALSFCPAASASPPPPSVLSPPLQVALKALLSQPALVRSRMGVEVRRLDTQAVLFAHQPDLLLVPASNVKLLTTAAALSELGPGYQFKTELYGQTDGRGTLKGPLVLKGFGDPYLTPERVWYLAGRLRTLGIRRVEGDIVVDDSFFSPQARMSRGSEQDLSSNAYMAPAGALSVGFNAIMVDVLPGAAPHTPAQVIVDPAQDYTEVDNQATTVSRGTTYLHVDVVPSGKKSKIVVRGRIHQDDARRAFWRRIDAPPLFAGAVFKQALQQHGIEHTGTVAQGEAQASLPLLVALGSPRLGDLIGPLNRYSNNFMAAQLGLVLGAHKFGAPATWEKTQAAMSAFFREKVGVKAGQFALGNPSGLHDVNRMSAHQMVGILALMHKDPTASYEFVNSLAVAASSGTLEGRMLLPPAAHLVRAKTGTLAGASALSGYVTSQDGVPLAFSFLVNGFGRIEDVWAAQDALGATLAAAHIEPAGTASQLAEASP